MRAESHLLQPNLVAELVGSVMTAFVNFNCLENTLFRDMFRTAWEQVCGGRRCEERAVTVLVCLEGGILEQECEDMIACLCFEAARRVHLISVDGLEREGLRCSCSALLLRFAGDVWGEEGF